MGAESKNQDTDFKGFQAVFFKKQNVKENSHVQQVMGSNPKGVLATDLDFYCSLAKEVSARQLLIYSVSYSYCCKGISALQTDQNLKPTLWYISLTLFISTVKLMCGNYHLNCSFVVIYRIVSNALWLHKGLFWQLSKKPNQINKGNNQKACCSHTDMSNQPDFDNISTLQVCEFLTCSSYFSRKCKQWKSSN